MRIIDADQYAVEMKMRQDEVQASIEHPRAGRYYTEMEHWQAVMLAFVEAKLTMDNMPTIDAAPVVHGHWEEPEPDGVVTFDKRAYAQCSECKKKSYLGWQDKYCRYCGSKNLEG